MATVKTQQKILDSFLDLLAETSYAEVKPALLAARAGVKMSVLRDCFPSKRSLVEAFASRIDRAVLDEQAGDMDDQPPRDRLFDVLMTRIDTLAPYKGAVAALMKAMRSDPMLALEVNPIAVRSQRWMLEAAGIDASGLRGQIIAQGVAVAFARVIDVWLREEDVGMPRTMAALDKELDRGEGFVRMLDRAGKLTGLVATAGDMLRRRSRREQDWETDDWGNVVPEEAKIDEDGKTVH